MDAHLLDPHALNEEMISYCGYCVPHPLRDEMLMTIIAPSDLVCRKVLATAAARCAKMFGEWRLSFGSQRK